jgi:hypothetical protein
MVERFEELVTGGTPKQAKLAARVIKKAFQSPDINLSRIYDVSLIRHWFNVIEIIGFSQFQQRVTNCFDGIKRNCPVRAYFV